MNWVDTHCHLQLTGGDPTPLVERAAAAGVIRLVCPGIDAATSERARDLAAELADRMPVAWTAGLHPHDADRWPDERDRVGRLAGEAAAVGEIGLDYYRNLSSPDLQREAFRDQVRLGVQLDKPLVVHCRDAFEDVYRIIDEEGAADRTVLHCWTGGPRWTRRFAGLGVYFSFAGPVAFETGDTVRRGAAVAPPQRCMVETDTPYLSPPPFRSEPNEPARVVLVGEALAEVWAVPVDEVARRTAATARQVYW